MNRFKVFPPQLRIQSADDQYDGISIVYDGTKNRKSLENRLIVYFLNFWGIKIEVVFCRSIAL
jgi:hypothetical protein